MASTYRPAMGFPAAIAEALLSRSPQRVEAAEVASLARYKCTFVTLVAGCWLSVVSSPPEDPLACSRDFYHIITGMSAGFRWNDWNLEHAIKHGCRIEEIESVVRRELRARRARHIGNEKLRVEGRGTGDRVMEVVFVFDDDEDDTIYVIPAMPLTTSSET